MGAGEVIEVLEKSKEPLTSTEISIIIDQAASSVKRILRALIKDTSVDLKYRQLSFDEKKLRYGHVVNPTLIRIYWLE